MESKINKQKIMKYVGAGLLTAAIGLGVGLEVYDTHVDHTKEICPITQFASSPLAVDGEYTPGYTVGIKYHQLPEMEKDYAEKGIEDVTVSYGELTEPIINTDIIAATKDSSGSYVVPSGYILATDANGNKIGVKKTQPTVESDIIPATKDSSGSYNVPSGYVLGVDENGNTVCVKLGVFERIVGYGIEATWGETTINPLTNEVIHENQETLKVR